MYIRDIFISHAWSYSEPYTGVVRLLNNANYFKWRNYSVPEHDPLVDPNTLVGKKKFAAMLDEQIRQASCFVVIAGMYVNNREWIQTEIDIAISYAKPIVGVRRRGQKITPTAITDIADRMSNWNSNSLATSIKEVC